MASAKSPGWSGSDASKAFMSLESDQTSCSRLSSENDFNRRNLPIADLHVTTFCPPENPDQIGTPPSEDGLASTDIPPSMVLDG
jgi:hypothetical protein